nr:hypothetical protein [Bartonella washoeensis]
MLREIAKNVAKGGRIFLLQWIKIQQGWESNVGFDSVSVFRENEQEAVVV